MNKVESFTIDHTKLKAPFVRKCGVQKGRLGDKISKFDLRFMMPNKEVMDTGAIHTIEHLLAGFMREKIEKIIDISPMGCRTGFYMITWGDIDVQVVIKALEYSLKKIIETEEVPAANEVQCGNYKEHSLTKAKEYANMILNKGISDKIYG